MAGAESGVEMLEGDFNRICHKIGSGAKFQLGRNHAGRVKLKLYRGPFGMFVRRFDLSDAEILRLRQIFDKTEARRKNPKTSETSKKLKPPIFKS
jgi:hypothetical protein